MKNQIKVLFLISSIAITSCTKETITDNPKTSVNPTPEQTLINKNFEPFVVGKNGGCVGLPGQKRDSLKFILTKTNDTICKLPNGPNGGHTSFSYTKTKHIDLPKDSICGLPENPNKNVGVTKNAYKKH